MEVPATPEAHPPSRLAPSSENPSTTKLPDMDERAGRSQTLVRRMLLEAREDVSNADQKASTVLAGLGVGVGAVVGGVLAGDWRPTSMQSPAMVLWWAGTIAVLAAMACAAFAVWPRYNTRDTAEGVYSWAHVAS